MQGHLLNPAIVTGPNGKRLIRNPTLVQTLTGPDLDTFKAIQHPRIQAWLETGDLVAISTLGDGFARETGTVCPYDVAWHAGTADAYEVEAQLAYDLKRELTAEMG